MLSTICHTLSLATLSLCFPSPKTWQTNENRDSASSYVSFYLSKIYYWYIDIYILPYYHPFLNAKSPDYLFLPIVDATSTLEILNLILKIMCEAWLDHIYGKRIKFRYSSILILLAMDMFNVCFQVALVPWIFWKTSMASPLGCRAANRFRHFTSIRLFNMMC